MSEPSRSELSARMRKVPGQLLLALVNGTAVLVIAAAILAIIASSKVTHVAQNVASTMTDAVLSRVDENPRQLVQNIQRVSDDVHTLTVALTKAKSEGVAGLGPEVAHLNERLGSLAANLDGQWSNGDVCSWHIADCLSGLASRPLSEVKQTLPKASTDAVDRKSLRSKCLDCCAYQPREVRKCVAVDCSFGHSPWG
jgi:hypothetical protein